METEIQWYIARDGQQHGPLSDIELRTFIARGHMKPNDLIWRAGFPDWRSAEEVFPQETGAAAAAAAAAGYGAAPGQPAHDPSPQQGRPYGGAADRQPTGGGPVRAADYGHDIDHMDDAGAFQGEPPPRRRKAGILAVLGVAVLGAGGYFAYQNRDMLLETSAAQLATVTSEKTPAATPVVAASTLESDRKALDARLQQTELWSFVKQEFPEWYLERLSGAAKLVAENKSDTEVAKHLVEGLVALRRENAQAALSASGERLRMVATAFVDNLKKLKEYSTDACYGFISQGEMNPIVLDLLQRPESSVHIQAQVTSIFQAIAEGRKSPVTHTKPVKADYDALVQQLAKLGWGENDLQLFSNPRALARLPHDKVCQMVQDWFVAHLAVSDQAAQERLLIETLRPVVSG